MSPHSKSRRELEDDWRQRVISARNVYLCASAQHMRAVEELGHGHMTPSDGSFAVASARRAEAWARHELTRTMHLYADLVVKGIAPPLDEDEKLLI
jgi:hypothetical protein